MILFRHFICCLTTAFVIVLTIFVEDWPYAEHSLHSYIVDEIIVYKQQVDVLKSQLLVLWMFQIKPLLHQTERINLMEM